MIQLAVWTINSRKPWLYDTLASRSNQETYALRRADVCPTPRRVEPSTGAKQVSQRYVAFRIDQLTTRADAASHF